MLLSFKITKMYTLLLYVWCSVILEFIILQRTVLQLHLLAFFLLSGPCAAVTAAATAAEPQPAAVRAGPARPPHRNPAAACTVHHLPDATGSAEWVLCYIVTLWSLISMRFLKRFVVFLALNRSPASPEPFNSTTSKPSQPPADPAKHHTCHTGQGWAIPFRISNACPHRFRTVHNCCAIGA